MLEPEDDLRRGGSLELRLGSPELRLESSSGQSSDSTREEVTEELERVTEELLQTQSTLWKTQHELNESTTKIRQLEYHLKMSSQQVAKMRSLREENFVLASEEQTLRGEVKILRGQLLQEQNNSSRSEVERKLKKAIELLQKDLKVSRNEHRAAESTIRDLKEKIERIEQSTEIKALQEKIRKTESKEKARQEELQEAREETTNLFEEIAILRSTLRKSEDKGAAEKLLRERVTRQVKDKITNDVREKVTKEVTQKVTREVKAAMKQERDKEINALRDQFKKLFKENAVLQERLEVAEAKATDFKDAEDEIEKLKYERSELRSTLDTSQIEQQAALGEAESFYRMKLQEVREEAAKEKWAHAAEIRQQLAKEREREARTFTDRLDALSRETDELLAEAANEKEAYGNQIRHRLEEEKQREVNALHQRLNTLSEESQQLLQEAVKEKEKYAKQIRRQIMEEREQEESKFMQRLGNLSQEKDALQQRIEVYEDELAWTKRENESNADQLKTSQNNLKASDDLAFRLKRRIQNLNTLVERYKKDSEELSEELLESKKSFREALTKSEDKTRKVSEKNKKLESSLGKTKENLSETSKELENAKKTSEEALSASEYEIDQLNEQNRSLSTLLDKFKSEYSELTKELDELKESSRESTQGLQNENIQLQEALQNANREITQYKSENSDISLELEEFKENLTTAENEVLDAKETITEMKRLLERYRNENSQGKIKLEESEERLKEARQALKGQATETKQKIEDMNAFLDRYRNEHSEVAKELEQSRQRYKEATKVSETEIEQLKLKINDLNSLLEKSTTENSQLSQDLVQSKQQSDALATFQDENSRLKEKLRDLEQHVKEEKSDHFEELEVSKQKSIYAMMSLENERTQLKEKIRGLKATVEKYRTERSDTAKEIDRAKSIIDSLGSFETENAQLKKDIEAHKKKFDDHKRENTKISKELEESRHRLQQFSMASQNETTLLKQNIETLNSVIDSYKSENHEAWKEVDYARHLADSLTSAEYQNIRLKKENHELNRLTEKYASEKTVIGKELDEARQNSKDYILASDNEREQLKGKIRELKSSADQYRSEFKGVLKELEHSRALSENLSTLENENVRLTAENQAANQLLDSYAVENSKISNELDELKQQAKKSPSRFSKEISKMKEVLKPLKDDLISYKMKHGDTSVAKELLKSMIATEKQVNQAISNLNQLLDDLRNEGSEFLLEGNSRQHSQSLEISEKERHLHAEEIHNMKLSLEKSKRELSEVSKELEMSRSHFRETLLDSDAEIAQLKQELTDIKNNQGTFNSISSEDYSNQTRVDHASMGVELDDSATVDESHPLNNELQKLNHVLNVYKNKFPSSSKEVEQIEQRIVDALMIAEDESIQLQKEIRNLNQMLDRYKRDHSEISKQLDEAKQNSGTDKSTTQLNQEIRNLGSLLAKTQMQHSETKLELEQSKHQLKKMVKGSEDETLQLKAKIKHLNSLIDTYSTEHSDISRAMESSTVVSEDETILLQEKIQGLTSLLSQYKQEHLETSKELEVSRQRLDVALAASGEETFKLKEKVTNLKSLISSYQHKHAESSQQALTSPGPACHDSVSAADDEVELVKQEIEKLDTLLTEASLEHSETLTDLKRTKQRLEKALTDSGDEVNQLKDKIKRLEMHLGKVKREKADTSKELVYSKRLFGEALMESETTIFALKDEVLKLSSVLQQSTEASSANKEEPGMEKQHLQEAENDEEKIEIANLHNRVQQLKVLLNNAKTKHFETKQELQNASEEARDEVSRLQEAIQSLQSSLAKVTSENTKITSDLKYAIRIFKDALVAWEEETRALKAELEASRKDVESSDGDEGQTDTSDDHSGSRDGTVSTGMEFSSLDAVGEEPIKTKLQDSIRSEESIESLQASLRKFKELYESIIDRTKFPSGMHDHDYIDTDKSAAGTQAQMNNEIGEDTTARGKTIHEKEYGDVVGSKVFSNENVEAENTRDTVANEYSSLDRQTMHGQEGSPWLKDGSASGGDNQGTNAHMQSSYSKPIESAMKSSDEMTSGTPYNFTKISISQTHDQSKKRKKVSWKEVSEHIDVPEREATSRRETKDSNVRVTPAQKEEVMTGRKVPGAGALMTPGRKKKVVNWRAEMANFDATLLNNEGVAQNLDTPSEHSTMDETISSEDFQTMQTTGNDAVPSDKEALNLIHTTAISRSAKTSAATVESTANDCAVQWRRVMEQIDTLSEHSTVDETISSSKEDTASPIPDSNESARASSPMSDVTSLTDSRRTGPSSPKAQKSDEHLGTGYSQVDSQVFQVDNSKSKLREQEENSKKSLDETQCWHEKEQTNWTDQQIDSQMIKGDKGYSDQCEEYSMDENNSNESPLSLIKKEPPSEKSSDDSNSKLRGEAIPIADSVSINTKHSGQIHSDTTRSTEQDGHCTSSLADDKRLTNETNLSYTANFVEDMGDLGNIDVESNSTGYEQSRVHSSPKTFYPDGAHDVVQGEQLHREGSEPDEEINEDSDKSSVVSPCFTNDSDEEAIWSIHKEMRSWEEALEDFSSILKENPTTSKPREETSTVQGSEELLKPNNQISTGSMRYANGISNVDSSKGEVQLNNAKKVAGSESSPENLFAALYKDRSIVSEIDELIRNSTLAKLIWPSETKLASLEENKNYFSAVSEKNGDEISKTYSEPSTMNSSDKATCSNGVQHNVMSGGSFDALKARKVYPTRTDTNDSFMTEGDRKIPSNAGLVSRDDGYTSLHDDETMESEIECSWRPPSVASQTDYDGRRAVITVSVNKPDNEIKDNENGTWKDEDDNGRGHFNHRHQEETNVDIDGDDDDDHRRDSGDNYENFSEDDGNGDNEGNGKIDDQSRADDCNENSQHDANSVEENNQGHEEKRISQNPTNDENKEIEDFAHRESHGEETKVFQGGGNFNNRIQLDNNANDISSENGATEINTHHVLYQQDEMNNSGDKNVPSKQGGLVIGYQERGSHDDEVKSSRERLDAETLDKAADIVLHQFKFEEAGRTLFGKGNRAARMQFARARGMMKRASKKARDAESKDQDMIIDSDQQRDDNRSSPARPSISDHDDDMSATLEEPISFDAGDDYETDIRNSNTEVRQEQSMERSDSPWDRESRQPPISPACDTDRLEKQDIEALDAAAESVFLGVAKEETMDQREQEIEFDKPFHHNGEFQEELEQEEKEELQQQLQNQQQQQGHTQKLEEPYVYSQQQQRQQNQSDDKKPGRDPDGSYFKHQRQEQQQQLDPKIRSKTGQHEQQQPQQNNKCEQSLLPQQLEPEQNAKGEYGGHGVENMQGREPERKSGQQPRQTQQLSPIQENKTTLQHSAGNETEDTNLSKEKLSETDARVHEDATPSPAEPKEMTSLQRALQKSSGRNWSRKQIKRFGSKKYHSPKRSERKQPNHNPWYAEIGPRGQDSS